MADSLFGIKKGVIVQQVNCQNVIGGGLSGAINKAFPLVETQYHAMFKSKTPEQLFGQKFLTKCTDNLYVCNLFTQFDFANKYKPETMGKKYTDEDKLIDQIERTTKYFKEKGLNVYVPYNIGCGLGGANWEDVFKRLKALNYDNLYIINTLKEKTFPIKEATIDCGNEEVKKEDKPIETKESVQEVKQEVKKERPIYPSEKPIQMTSFAEFEKNAIKSDCAEYLARDYVDKTVSLFEKEGFIRIDCAIKEPYYDLRRIEYSYKDVIESFEFTEKHKGIQIQSKEFLKNALEERNAMLEKLDFLRTMCETIGVSSVKLLDKYNIKILEKNNKKCGIILSTDTGLSVRHSDLIYGNGGDYLVERFYLDDFPKMIEEGGYKHLREFTDVLITELIEVEKKLEDQKKQNEEVMKEQEKQTKEILGLSEKDAEDLDR